MSILAKIVIGIPVALLGIATLFVTALGAGAGMGEACYREIKQASKKEGS